MTRSIVRRLNSTKASCWAKPRLRSTRAPGEANSNGEQPPDLPVATCAASPRPFSQLITTNFSIAHRSRTELVSPTHLDLPRGSRQLLPKRRARQPQRNSLQPWSTQLAVERGQSRHAADDETRHARPALTDKEIDHETT
jgi:hypothetical protein